MGIAFLFTIERVARSSHGVTPLLGWLAGLGFFLFVPLAVLVVNGGYQIPHHHQVSGYWSTVDLSHGAFMVPFFVIWVTVMLSLLTVYAFTPQRHHRRTRRTRWPVNAGKLRTVIVVTSGLAIIQWVVSIALFGGVEAYFSTHWYFRHGGALEQLGEIFLLYLKLSQANQIVFTAATGILIINAIRFRRWPVRLLVWCLCIVVLDMIMSGNRILVALLVLYTLTGLFVYGRVGWLATLVAASPLAILFFSAWAYIRSNLTNLSESFSTYLYQMPGLYEATVSILIDVTEGANVMLLLHIIQDFGDRYELLWGQTYMKALTFFIPRSVFPNKSDSFSVITANIYEPGSATSLSSTALGELYANFGMGSIVLLPLITLTILHLSRAIERRMHNNALLSATLFMIFAWMARATFSDNVITILFCLALIRGLRFEKGLYRSAGTHNLSHSTVS